MHEGYLPILFGVLSCSGGRSNELSAWEAVEESVCHSIPCQIIVTVYMYPISTPLRNQLVQLR